MQTYGELLKESILTSGMTLDHIVKECKARGLDIHNTYISKLRLGQRPAPADENITRVLCDVIGADPNKLIWQGYIDRAPEEVRELLAAMDQDIINLTIRARNGMITKEQFSEVIRSSLGKQASTHQIDSDEVLEERVVNPTSKEILKDLKEYRVEQIKESSNVVQLPIKGKFFTHPNEILQEDLFGFDFASKVDLHGKYGFIIQVVGDGMMKEEISNGDRLVLIEDDFVTPSDIALVYISGKGEHLKKVKFQEDMCILMPVTYNSDPMLAKSKEVKILGKVVEVRHRFSN